MRSRYRDRARAGGFANPRHDGKLGRVAFGGQDSGETGRGARRAFAVACLCAVLIGLAGCAGLTTGLPVASGDAPIPPRDPAARTTLQIRYLGAGGVLLTRGEDSVLTAPFFSNPSILRVAFGPIEADPDQIGRFLGPQDAPVLAGVQAVLVGHAHYDHLMDVPYIKKHFLPNAKIYGSDTMRNTLLGDNTLRPEDLVSVEADAWSAPVEGRPEPPPAWWPAGERVRFMALKSEHASIVWGIKFFEGHYREPLPALPASAWDWREGQTLAYLIDFLAADGKTVEFRVHYQDAASNPPFGFPPLFKGAPDERPVDVAILCVPGFNQVTNYPDALIERIKPRSVILVHWENFFAPLPDDARHLQVVPNTDVGDFLARLKPGARDTRVTLPAPGAWLRYAP
jgi:L-ascorbate metabolism protein UlaG (beta-lactamase superfamily)